MKKALRLLTIAALLVMLLASCQPLPEEPVHEHTWENFEAVAATCTTAGHTAYKVCTVCGEKEGYEEIAALGHDLIDATCEDAHHIKTCSRCGYGISDETVMVEKASDWVHVNGSDVIYCECATCGDKLIASAQVGSVGPTGGRIFYDCDADNSEKTNDGLVSTTRGWRYLEAAPSLLYMADSTTGTPAVYTDIPDEATPLKGIYGYYYDESNAKIGVMENAEASANIGMGKQNTEVLYEKICKNGTDIAYSEKYFYAAHLCTALEFTAANEVTYDDWFLPSSAELKQYYLNISEKNIDQTIIPPPGSKAVSYMTSTEKKDGYEATHFTSWKILDSGADTDYKTAMQTKDTALRILAVRSFL